MLTRDVFDERYLEGVEGRVAPQAHASGVAHVVQRLDARRRRTAATSNRHRCQKDKGGRLFYQYPGRQSAMSSGDPDEAEAMGSISKV